MFSLSSSTQSAINDRLPLFRVHLLDMNFSSGQMRLCDYHHDLSHLGNTWDALAGGILNISHIIEDSTNIAHAWSVTFGEMMITTLLTQQFEGRNMQLYLALVELGAIVGEPIVLAAGEMSSDWIEEPNPETLTITIQGESFWADQFDPIMHARTDEGQRARFPGDTGLSSVARMQKQSVEFPGAGTHYYH